MDIENSDKEMNKGMVFVLAPDIIEAYLSDKESVMNNMFDELECIKSISEGAAKKIEENIEVVVLINVLVSTMKKVEHINPIKLKRLLDNSTCFQMCLSCKEMRKI